MQNKFILMVNVIFNSIPHGEAITYMPLRDVLGTYLG
jgi:hypothetical protein